VYKSPYRLTPAETTAVEENIKELLQEGLIEPSTSPYGSPIIFVEKPGQPGKLRMCIDTRALNAQTIPIRTPIPRQDMLFDRLHGACVFSTLDLQSGFHQIRINEADVPKTAFLTPFGQYHFKVLSFGFCNSPATFQAMMNKTFAPLLYKGVLVYLDDILIYAKTREEHDRLLEEVLQILEKNQFYARLSKCEFEKDSLKYLGHIISKDGISVDPIKTQVVQNWPQPSSVKQVRSFLGLANYFRKFLKGYATMAAPLTTLTRKDVKWSSTTWNANCQKAFDEIKQALLTAPCLALMDFTNPGDLKLITDASITGIGAVLTQNGRPVAFESKKLTEAEVKWTTTEQEMWAVIHSLHIWRCYLEGVKFEIHTDHNPLVYLKTQPNLSRRQARWSDYLQRFEFEWKYVKGTENTAADALSRAHEEPLNSVTLKAMVLRTRPSARPSENTTSPQPTRKRVRNTDEQTLLPRSSDRSETTRVGDGGNDPQLNTAIGRSRRHLSTTVDEPQPPAARASPPRDLETVIEHMSEGYKQDPWFSDAKNTADLEYRDDLWWSGPRVAVPDIPGIRLDIMTDMHNPPFQGHPGVGKMLNLVKRHYWWPGITRDVTKFVTACPDCQRNKSSSQKPAGLLHPLPIPDGPWDSVSMDFIVQLPPTALRLGQAQGYDAILVFVDRLTKMVKLAPTYTTCTAEETAKLFLAHVFADHGLPDSIITDRGSVFTGTFWTTLLQSLGTKHCKTTAFHPQADGQTERVNRVLEDMLRHYVGSTHQTDWDVYLPMAQFAINNSRHSATSTTPFRLNYGRDPKLPLSVRPITRDVPSVERFSQDMQSAMADAKRCLEAAQQRMKLYYDKHHRHVEYSVGTQVLLSTKHINLQRAAGGDSCRKLMPRYIGPFPIEKVVGKGAYKLTLPAPLRRLHNVFNVCLLKPYQSDGRSQPPPPLLTARDDGEMFLIDTVLGHRVVSRGKTLVRQYLIKWTGYGSEHNSWEPESEIARTAFFGSYWSTRGSPPSLVELLKDKRLEQLAMRAAR
jgi:hypothetical protein